MHTRSLSCLALTCLLSTCVVLSACSESTQNNQRPDFPWNFVKVAELDTGNDEALLGNLWSSAAAIGPDGAIFIATSSWAGIHEFQINGEWRRNLGGEGHGPGEFQSVRYVAVSPTGRLAIYDNVGKVSFLASGGEFLNSFMFRINLTFESRIMFAGNTRLWAFTYRPGRGIEEGSNRQDLVLFSEEGDTLRTYSIQDYEPYIVIEHDGMPLTARNPGVGVPKGTVSPDGTAWVLMPNGEQLVCISPETGELDTLAVRLPTPVFTREQWAQIVEVWTSEMREDESFSAFIQPITNTLEQIRESMSPVQRMWWIDGNGILVDRMPAPSPITQKDPWRYAALLQDGRMTKEVNGPPSLLSAEYGYALQATIDPSGLPNLTLWKLEPIGG